MCHHCRFCGAGTTPDDRQTSNSSDVCAACYKKAKAPSTTATVPTITRKEKK